MECRKILPVILSGGVGSRLWPLSREKHPKPFVKLKDDDSLIQNAYRRALSIATLNDIVTVTNRDFFFYTKDEYGEIGGRDVHVTDTFLLEPIGRNSAPAIALAMSYALEYYGEDCVLLTMPADHFISDLEQFLLMFEDALALADEERLVTFGKKANSPETGFGYMKTVGSKVLSFIEKPDKSTALKFVESGDYYWNTGIFCFQAGAIKKALKKNAPALAQVARNSYQKARRSSSENWRQFEIRQPDFEQIDAISIDYAIFEKSDNIAMVPCHIGWSDVGSWDTFGSLLPQDNNGNSVVGDVLVSDTYDSIIYSESRVVTTLGIRGLVIADTSDALLVMDKNRSQDVKKIVGELKAKDNQSYYEFPKIYRDWGTYITLSESSLYRIRYLEIKGYQSLQMHLQHFCSGHLVILEGEALIDDSEQARTVTKGRSTFISPGLPYKLSNRRDEKLVVIEVQCGASINDEDTAVIE